MGKKTIEDFAQLKLIRRQSAAERGKNLHCNGKTLNMALRGKECDHRETRGRSSVSMECRPLMSARQSKPPLASDSLPQRPQSAKPVLQSQHQHESILSTKEAELSASPQSKIHSKKKKRKKTAERKSGRLSPSKSAPVLPDRPTHKKINIIVNMRNLRLFEEPGLLSSASSPVISREAWGD
ncbi:hypothetical protein V7S43_010796 [Phytophthora oleae]|uniref:Uncharacterized protein n=1 Tax=Phytophthora oleae TaxID=2107226 RepID=A0ABD3FDA7_9STRA